MSKKISRRDFIRTGVAGTVGFIAGTTLLKNVIGDTAQAANPVSSFGNDAAVDQSNGNLYRKVPLFNLPSGKFGQELLGEFALYYNSKSKQHDVIAKGWTHTLNIRLKPNNNQSFTLIEGDGSRVTLYRSGDRFVPENASYPYLVVGTASSDVYRKDGVAYRFDLVGRLAYVFDRNQNTVSFTYEGVNLRVTDYHGRTILIQSDANGHINQITDPLGNIHTLTIMGNDLMGISSSIIGEGVRNWGFTYLQGSYMSTATDPLGFRFQYFFDSQWRLERTIDPGGNTKLVRYVVNATQNETQISEAATAGVWDPTRVWTTRFDPTSRQVIAKIDPLGHITTFNWFSNGDMRYMENHLGRRWTYEYDANRNVILRQDPIGYETKITWHSVFHNLPTVIELPGSATWRFEYDGNGNLAKTSDPEGFETSITPNARGNVYEVRNALEYFRVGYNANQYVEIITNMLTQGVMTFTGYDSAGNFGVMTDPLNHRTEYRERNGFGFAQLVVDHNLREWRSEFNVVGLPTRFTDPTSKWVLFGDYNWKGQKGFATTPIGTTRFYYGTGCVGCGEGNGTGMLTRLVDPENHEYAWDYDAAKNLREYKGPLGYTRTFTPNEVGFPIQVVDENGRKTLVEPDNLNRARVVTFEDGTQIVLDRDGRGNITNATNQTIGYTIGYDRVNRPISFADSWNRLVQMGWNGLSERTLLRCNGLEITHTRNETGLLHTLAANLVGSFRYWFDVAGRRDNLVFPNGVRGSYGFSEVNRLTSLAYLTGTVEIARFSYVPDPAGYWEEMTDPGLHEVDYDEVHRVRMVAHPGLSEVFDLDPRGNRVGTYPDAENRIREDKDFLYRFDPCGNMTEKTRKWRPFLSIQYFYDPQNHLVRIESEGRVLARFKYDPFGLRVEKEINGKITRFLLDYPDGNVLAEFDGSDNLLARYVHGIGVDEPLAKLTGVDNLLFYHADGNGNVRLLTNGLGEIVKTYNYLTYGGMYSTTGNNISQPYGFAGGQREDIEVKSIRNRIRYSRTMKPGVQVRPGQSGGGVIWTDASTREELYYFRARFYDPKSGRFLTKDPIGFAAGDVNLYRYVFSNPVNFTDPYGEIAPVLLGAIFGGIGGAMGAWTKQDYTWSDVLVGIAIGAGTGAMTGGASALATFLESSVGAVYLGALAGELGNVLSQLYAKRGGCEKIDIGSVIGSLLGGGISAPLKGALGNALKNELLKNSPQAAEILGSYSAFGPSFLMPQALSNIGGQIGR